jgi:hypothetical protein
VREVDKALAVFVFTAPVYNIVRAPKLLETIGNVCSVA